MRTVRTRALPVVIAPTPGFRDHALQRDSVTLALDDPPRDLLAAVLDHRDRFVGELLFLVGRVIGDLSSRPVDFGMFVDLVAAALGGPAATLAALSTHIPAPVEPDGELLALLQAWARAEGNEGRRVTLADLAEELDHLGHNRGASAKFGNTRALAQRLHRLRPGLELTLGMQVHRLRSRGREVSFRVKSSEPG